MTKVPISTIVNVAVTRQDKGITQAGFGTPLILGTNGSFGGDHIRTYVDIDEVLDDFASSDEEYLAAAAIFSQNPKVKQIKIGVEDARVAQVSTIVFDDTLITGNTVDGEVNGAAITSVPFNTDNATTLSDLAAIIAAVDGISTAVSNGTDTITVTADAAGIAFVLSNFVVTGGADQAGIVITTTTDNLGIAEILNTIAEEDDDWYGLIWTERSALQVLEAAKAIETRYKIFGTCSSDSDLLDSGSSTDIAAVLFAGKYARTYVIYNADDTDFADAAWMGNRFPFDPGTENWMFAQLVGITADSLTSSKRASLIAKNANYYVTIGGVDMTEPGMMASGEYIDVIRLTDWLHARIQENVFQAIVSLPKIPYTDDGIAIVKNKIREVLQKAEKDGGIAADPQFTVTAPRALDVSQTNRANRFLPDVKFTCRVTGAIDYVDVAGTVAV